MKENSFCFFFGDPRGLMDSIISIFETGPDNHIVLFAFVESERTKKKKSDRSRVFTSDPPPSPRPAPPPKKCLSLHYRKGCRGKNSGLLFQNTIHGLITRICHFSCHGDQVEKVTEEPKKKRFYSANSDALTSNCLSSK